MNCFLIIGGFTVGFFFGWLLALVIITVIPILGIAMFIYLKLTMNIAKINAQAYASSGGLAEQALNAIKTVKSLCGEQYEVIQY